MKLKLWAISVLFSVALPLYAAGPLDTPDTLTLAKSMLSTSVHYMPQSTKMGNNARSTYEEAKAKFLKALENAINKKKDPQVISNIVTNCFIGMATAWKGQLDKRTLSHTMCNKIPDEKKAIVLWNIAELTQAPQTPAIKATEDYMGCKVLSLCLNADTKLPEEKEALAYRKESAYLLTAASALNR